MAHLLPERTTPELHFLETKGASLMSSGMTTQLLEDVLPTDDALNAFHHSQSPLGGCSRVSKWSFSPTG
jgi:hypothetical protein